MTNKLYRTLRSQASKVKNRYQKRKAYPCYEKKRLYEKGSESSLSERMSPEVFAGQLKSYDVISFDVFDTLLFRPVSVPADLFFFPGEKYVYMDFKRIRCEMERRARKKKYQEEQHYEVTLDEIYEVLEEETGLKKEEVMQTELELEAAFCFANPYMLRVTEYLERSGKRMILTSDMYLNAEQILKLLERCGYKGFGACYVSCDYSASKHRGDLYSIVKRTEGEENSFIHIGDNYISDVIQARKHGFAVQYYPNVNQRGMKYRAEDMSAITGSLYRGIVNAHIHNGSNVYSREYEYGYIYGGLFVTGYCQMIHRYVQQEQIEKILFLSRDGYVLKKVYEKMYPEECEKCEYIYWSRLAAAKMTAGYFKYDYFRRFLYHKVNQNYTIEQIFESMELTDMLAECCMEQNLGKTEELTEKNVDNIKEFLMKMWKRVLEHYEEQLQAGEQYFSERLAGCKRAVAVDIGWAGSGAIALDCVLNRIWRMNCNVTGMIAGTNSANNTEPDAGEAFLKSGKLVSYLYSQSENRDIWKYHHPGRKHNLYWEMLLDAPTGSFQGFYLDENGKCIFKWKERKRNWERGKQVQEGIFAFVEQYMEWQGRTSLLPEIGGRDAYAPMLLLQGAKNRRFMRELEALMDDMNVE